MTYVRDGMWLRLQYLNRRNRVLGPSVEGLDGESHWEDYLHSCTDTAHDLDLRKAIDTLEDRQRAILHAYYFDQLLDREIASALGVSTDIVRAARYEALKKLRKILGVPQADGMAGIPKLTSQQRCLLGHWNRLGGSALKGLAASDAKIQAALAAGYTGCRATLRASSNRAIRLSA